MQTIEQFALEAVTNNCLLAESGLTVNEWRAIKNWVFHSAICEPEVLAAAEQKVSEFNAFMGATNV